MAYRDVSLNTEPSVVQKNYENLEMILTSADDQSGSMANNETTTDIYATISPRQPGVEHQSVH